MTQTGGESRRRHLGMLTSLTLVLGCAPQDTYTPPGFGFSGSYHTRASGAPVLLSNDLWWGRMNDPVLNRLIATALTGNLSLAAARARVAGAQAAAAATPGLVTLTPTLTANAAGVTGQPVASQTGQMSLIWLLDPYGAHQAAKGAARAQVEVAEAELAAARLLVLYNLGNAYVDLRYRQALVGLRDQEMQSRRQTLAMTRNLLAAQDATTLDSTRSEARVAEIEAQMPGLRAAVTAKKNEIAVLVGQAPGSLSIDLDNHSSQPRPDMSPDIGIPADLLRNRPDIRVAERNYYSALTGLTQAEAAQYPRLSLSGSLTLELARGGSSYAFGPSLQLPSLPNSVRAGMARARAAIDEAHANWQATVLTALAEAENAMLDYQAATASQQAAEKAARLYGKSLDLTRRIFGQGDATLSDVISAEQELAQSRQSLAETLYQRGLSFVALNVRLGAGHGVAAVSDF